MQAINVFGSEAKKTINANRKVKEVKQDIRVTFALKPKMSVMSRKILAMIFQKIIDQESFDKPIVFKVMEMSDYCLLSKNTLYRESKIAVREILKTSWELETEEQGVYDVFSLLRSGHVRNGTIIIRLNEDLSSYFLHLKKYTSYSLREFMGLSSSYSQIIYELLSNYSDTGFFYIAIGEYRIRMNCEKKYSIPSKLISQTLKEPLKEIAKTSLAFKYGLDTKPGIDGKKEIKGIYFNYLYTGKNSSNSQTSEEVEIKEILIEKWKITNSNIEKYFNVIGVLILKRLIHKWSMKNASLFPIESPLKYCNAVFVRMGKEAKVGNLMEVNLMDNLLNNKIPKEEILKELYSND